VNSFLSLFSRNPGVALLSHLSIDLFSHLTRHTQTGVFEFNAQTLRQSFIGSFVFDEPTGQTGHPSGHAKSRQESTYLSFPSLDDSSPPSSRHD